MQSFFYGRGRSNTSFSVADVVFRQMQQETVATRYKKVDKGMRYIFPHLEFQLGGAYAKYLANSKE